MKEPKQFNQSSRASQVLVLKYSKVKYTSWISFNLLHCKVLFCAKSKCWKTTPCIHLGRVSCQNWIHCNVLHQKTTKMHYFFPPLWQSHRPQLRRCTEKHTLYSFRGWQSPKVDTLRTKMHHFSASLLQSHCCTPSPDVVVCMCTMYRRSVDIKSKAGGLDSRASLSSWGTN